MATKKTKPPARAKEKVKSAPKAPPDGRAPEVKRIGGRFAKGHSGNPGGMPKGFAEVRALAREHTTDAIAALVDVAKSGGFEPARVSAAVAILDRGWGKPAQAVELTGAEGGPVEHAASVEIVHELPQVAEILAVMVASGAVPAPEDVEGD